MTRYALDANILIAWLFSEQGSQVRDFFSELRVEDELVSAPILLGECTSVIRGEVFSRRLRHEQAQERIERLLDLPLTVVDEHEQYPRALELARRFQHKKAYDMLHLAVAELTGAELATFDRGLLHAANEIGVPVRSIR